MSSWMSEYVDAWNSHNGERVAAFMADDVVYEDLALRQIHEGREAIIGFVQASEEFSKDHKFVLVSEHTSGDRDAFEWEMIGTYTGESLASRPPTSPSASAPCQCGHSTPMGGSRTTGTTGTWPTTLYRSGFSPPPQQ